MTEESETCRCGHNSTGVHPCHGKGYTCKEPGTPRYVTYPTALAGAQMKLGAYKTWACDSCWEFYQNLMKKKTSKKNAD